MSDPVLTILITGITSTLASIIAGIFAYLARKEAKTAVVEVRSANAQTLAQQSDANESRRIEKIPIAKRTELEESHITSIDKAATRDNP